MLVYIRQREGICVTFLGVETHRNPLYGTYVVYGTFLVEICQCNMAVLFITGWISAYNIFLVQQSLRQIGDDYREAAEIDGAGFFRVIFSIYMPMLKPIVALMVLQTFIGQWNDYLFPVLFLPSARSLWPIGVLSVKIQSDYLYTAGTGGLMNYPMVMAMGVFMMIPPIAVYITCQRYFIQGITLGGVKS